MQTTETAEASDTDPLEHSDLLVEIARALVDHPEEVEVLEKNQRGSSTTVLVLRVAKEDRGKVIGKGGATINLIRGLFSRIAAIDHCQLAVMVEDETKKRRRAKRRRA
jgi:predicted RNA-binding protein YlqC (UPF0109 family)